MEIIIREFNAIKKVTVDGYTEERPYKVTMVYYPEGNVPAHTVFHVKAMHNFFSKTPSRFKTLEEVMAYFDSVGIIKD